MMEKRFVHILLLFIAYMTLSVHSISAVNVTLLIDEGKVRPSALGAAEQNLSQILTEINHAQKTKNIVSVKNLKMDDFSKKSLARLWAVSPFYCDDEEIVERCWIFKDGTMMVSHIPIIITPINDKFGLGTYQEAVVEFDNKGNVTDFRFSLSAQTGLSLEDCGTEDVENEHIIWQQVERFRTAYNMKDIETIETMFSDDALIITGNVVMRRKPGDTNAASYDVVYNRQNKQQYINNLKKCFARNNWIDVKFDRIGSNGEEGGCAGITRSNIDRTKYGVRLRQSWKSSNYEDEGYLFLLFEFPEHGDPIIHVRTWQPEWSGKTQSGKGTHLQPDDDISTLGGFGL